ncbi:hypothetical protein CA3LBN_002343 [Candidozyma haemuli]|uniref:Conserved oligomeric Golgi complex subunit 8 n=1 Tax=Candidozyma haemuli TaxID=45357 RepID=A0ABX8I9X4_9ASCO|nr:hypothetical protein CA3LBN_002343 [[Candida] haemuloni]
MSSILLDTLKDGLDPGLAGMLEKDPELKKDTQQYLEELLVNSELLSTEMFTSSTETKGKNLVEEIAELDHQSRQIELQLATIANENRDLIVGVTEDVKLVHNTIGEDLNKNIAAMKQGFENKIAVDNKAVKKVSQAISANNSILHNMDSILDIYELPTLCGLCIMQGNYQEALEISTSVKMLTVKFPNSKTFKQLQTQVDNELKLMVRGLIKLLNTNLKQSNILKIFQILNRPNLVTSEEDENDQTISGNKTLKLIYLNSRFKFIMNEVASLQPLLKLKKLTYLKRYIEIYREHLYNSLSIYHAIFLSTGLKSDTNDDKLLLHMYIKKLVYLMVEELRTHLPKVQEGENTADEVELNSLRDGVILQVIYLCRSLSKYGLDFERIWPN